MGDFMQRNAHEVAKLVRGILLASPGSLALIASRGNWRLARHLKLLDTAVRQAASMVSRFQLLAQKGAGRSRTDDGGFAIRALIAIRP